MDVQKKSHGKLLPRVVYRGFSNYQNYLSLLNYTCFYILNGNLNPTPEDYRAAFLINADVIRQTAPQFSAKLCLFSCQIFQLSDEVREYLLRVILFLDECLQFLKSAVLFSIQGAEFLFFLCLLRLIQGYTCILLDEVRKVLCDNSQFLFYLTFTHASPPIKNCGAGRAGRVHNLI